MRITRTVMCQAEIATARGRDKGPAGDLATTVDFASWRRIGRLIFDDAVVSYNGDFVIHFNHPTWRSDRNDPATATRLAGRKVRRIASAQPGKEPS